MNINKKISTPIAILIIVVIATLIGGVFYWQSQEIKGKDSEVKTSEEKSIQKGNIDNWKTYTSKKYNFKMKHPEGWHVYSSDFKASGIIGFSNLTREEFQNKKPSKELDNIYLLQVRVINSEIDDWLEKNKEMSEQLGTDYTREKVSFNGKEGYKIFSTTEEGEKGLSKVLFKKGRVYIINVMYPEKCRGEECNFSKQMISTFEFIN